MTDFDVRLTLKEASLGDVGPSDDADFAEFFASEVAGQVKRAHLLLGSVDEANDIVQQAFVRMLEVWGTIEHPGSYLNRVVLNLCRDRARRQTLWQRTLVRLRPTDDSFEHDILDDVLLQLPFNQRAAIVLRYWGQLSTDEIAAQLDCPRGSVGPWITRGLEKMKGAISE